MRKLFFVIAILVISTSCEDVIEVDLNTMQPKLVIEASLNWFKGTRGNEQFIKLSLTAPYFDNNIQPAVNASVSIKDQNNITYVFLEDEAKGLYINRNFVPKIDQTYKLLITYDDETYEGKEILKPVVDIDYVSQNMSGGILDEQTEIKAYYTDPEDEINFYFFEFVNKRSLAPSLEVYEDKFTNGNQIFGYYSTENLIAGDEVVIRNYGISEQFYNYMFILLQQSSEVNGGPFETQPASVKGNCVNITNPDNYPLGYFRLSEVSEIIYTVQ